MLLQYSVAVERRIWPHQHPLRQFETTLSPELLMKLEGANASLDHLWDMEPSEIGAMLRFPAAGRMVKNCLDAFPYVIMEANVQPITRSVLRVRLSIEATFRWRESAHGNALKWNVWVEDSENEHIYHSESFFLTQKQAKEGPQALAFTIPIFEPIPAQYYVRCICDNWLGAEQFLALSFHNLILPEKHPPHTQLLDLQPLPLEALKNAEYISMYRGRFTHFNAIQTQAFHTLYHTDHNVLLGAPTGSGKTVSSELAMLRAFNEYPGQKVIYIAPLKALVKERIGDWRKGLCMKLNKRMVELTGDYTPDLRALLGADLIVATPEKWDGISRNWQNRAYVQKVSLVIIDEIHLLGADRGPILETGRQVRFVGLSTALANARDLGDWLGIDDKVGLFNFRPSVRPVPLEVHIQGYPGKFYCPRMATMNKPTYAAITSHSPTKPVLVFVSSRRQTRLTALDLIAYAAANEQPRNWVHMEEHEEEAVLSKVKDPNLRHTLAFGIGMHHAGLNEDDRTLCEHLFVTGKIQILVATSTLAWGVNFPAHLVVIKGTEFFDGATRRYVDFPITDVLQMMGRAGRPQFDNHGVAVILVHEPKKSFYKKFLYEPFPVESSLPDSLHDHFNAEIVGGTVTTKQDAVDYLTWTYFFRRLMQNPSYYNLESVEHDDVNGFLSSLVEGTLGALEDARCIEILEDDSVEPLTLGRVAAYYYLQYQTVAMFSTNLNADLDLEATLMVLCGAAEYDELPVRHNEDRVNAELAKEVRMQVDLRTADDPHTKANLLMQAHFGRVELPMSDYVTDTRSCLDNSVRIIQALVDVCADAGWLGSTLNVMNLMQMCMQARWIDDPSTSILPHIDFQAARRLQQQGLGVLPQLVAAAASSPDKAQRALVSAGLTEHQARAAQAVATRLPLVHLDCHLQEAQEGGKEEESELRVHVTMTRTNAVGRTSKGGIAHAYAPRFPKMKEEGWWLVLGNRETRELYALKRTSFGKAAKCSLSAPLEAAQGALTLFFLSDCYIGLDQEVELRKPERKGRQRRGARRDHAQPATRARPTAEDAEEEEEEEEEDFWEAAIGQGGKLDSREATSQQKLEQEEPDEEDFWDMSGTAGTAAGGPARSGARQEDGDDDEDEEDFWDMSRTVGKADGGPAGSGARQEDVDDDDDDDEDFWDMSRAVGKADGGPAGSGARQEDGDDEEDDEEDFWDMSAATTQTAGSHSIVEGKVEIVDEEEEEEEDFWDMGAAQK
ncbi:activating signal cointegrator 1 complex subunit [Cymbomonas tetramitiformis]|uniref:Activating signal cointegrator 1 complex subunit n=1 Tax=Cymbomonas tetramitiformis TaxID=36881 RepID=A0AAE0EVV8_9CHLO|nr:activating signal cointegrator 1 complex subunit [Cymbomonas tetramitiformis]